MKHQDIIFSIIMVFLVILALTRHLFMSSPIDAPSKAQGIIERRAACFDSIDHDRYFIKVQMDTVIKYPEIRYALEIFELDYHYDVRFISNIRPNKKLNDSVTINDK